MNHYKALFGIWMTADGVFLFQLVYFFVPLQSTVLLFHKLAVILL